MGVEVQLPQQRGRCSCSPGGRFWSASQRRRFVRTNPLPVSAGSDCGARSRHLVLQLGALAHNAPGAGLGGATRPWLGQRHTAGMSPRPAAVPVLPHPPCRSSPRPRRSERPGVRRLSTRPEAQSPSFWPGWTPPLAQPGWPTLWRAQVFLVASNDTSSAGRPVRRTPGPACHPASLPRLGPRQSHRMPTAPAPPARKPTEPATPRPSYR